MQHGLGGSRSDALGTANELARGGIATVAIDAPFHGMRSPRANDLHSFSRSYDGPDGLADGPSAPNVTVAFDMVSQLKNFLATRDNFWQATLDLVQLRRLVAGCDLSLLADEYGGTAPKLDATHLGFVGISMGGILGTLLAGVEPKSAIDPFVVDVPGAGLMRVFTESPNFAGQSALATSLAGLPIEALDGNLFSAFINLGQGIFDSADAGSFAADATAHNIWMIGAMYDETIPRVISDSLARALGATQLTPTLRPVDGLTQGSMVLTPDGSGRLVGYFELAPATHPHLVIRTGPINDEPPVPRDTAPRFPKLPQPIILREPILGTQRAIVDFLQSTWAGSPKIAVDSPQYLGVLPVADIDDDGYCDDDERAAGSDPFDRSSIPASGTPNCVRDVGFDFPM
jgi:pimeloyl-ACP methyl ester carboxylesterase